MTDKNFQQTIIDIDDEDYCVGIPKKYSTYNTCILPSGALIKDPLQNNDKEFWYYSAETGEVSLPLPMVQDSHGLEQSVSARFLSAYKNKVYYISQDQECNYYLSCINLDTKEWTIQPSEQDVKTGYDYRQSFGKYILMNRADGKQQIYNMETDEWGPVFSEQYGYFGGNCHIAGNTFDQPHFGIKTYSFPKDGSAPESNTIPVECSDPKTAVYPVNGKYYLLMDSAGIFLRTYDGSEDEVILYVFDN